MRLFAVFSSKQTRVNSFLDAYTHFLVAVNLRWAAEYDLPSSADAAFADGNVCKFQAHRLFACRHPLTWNVQLAEASIRNLARMLTERLGTFASYLPVNIRKGNVTSNCFDESENRNYRCLPLIPGSNKWNLNLIMQLHLFDKWKLPNRRWKMNNWLHLSPMYAKKVRVCSAR